MASFEYFKLVQLHIIMFVNALKTLSSIVPQAFSNKLVYMESLHLFQRFPCLRCPAGLSSFLSQLA